MIAPLIMTNPALNFLAVALYAGAGLVIGRELLRGSGTNLKYWARAFALFAAVLHALVLVNALQLDGGLNLALTSAFSLVAWVVVCLYLLASLSRPVDNLGAIVLPLAAVTMLVEWWWPGEAPTRLSSVPQASHIVISILAYSLMCLAAIQSLMLLAQENELRHKHAQGIVRALPPMQTMEAVMFQMIGVGFLLLSLTLASGLFFSEVVFGTPFKLTHHVVLAALGWAVYAILLFGRWRLGWRGRIAVRWTLGGFALLVLAYFGSKFVFEVILHR